MVIGDVWFPQNPEKNVKECKSFHHKIKYHRFLEAEKYYKTIYFPIQTENMPETS